MIQNLESKTIAVISGDIIKSSSLNVTDRNLMLLTLEQTLSHALNIFSEWKFELFQGDSFQGVLGQDPKLSLRLAIWLFTRLRAAGFWLRVSIGIGNTGYHAERISLNDGTAFQFSGRMLEEIKKRKDSFLGLITGEAEINAEFAVHATTLDYLLARCTPLQAEALSLSLQQMTQVQIAKNLKVTQPTVQQRLQAAGWPVFKAILARFESKY